MKLKNEDSGRQDVLFIPTVLTEYEQRNTDRFATCNKTKGVLPTSADVK
jgi:hypothetical protein